MKLRIIDLINKIANREELPYKIRYNDRIYYRVEGRVDLHIYQTEGTLDVRRISLIIDNEYLNLNDEVEILEEDKRMEKIEIKYWDDEEYTPEERLNVCMTYINNLIDEINKLKEMK